MKEKKVKSKKTEFSMRGWDWTDISKILEVNLDIGDQYILSNTRKKIRNIIMKLYDNKQTQQDIFKINQIRFFIKKLSENNNTYIWPLWVGLGNIKEDTEFLRFIDLLLPYLWD